MTTERNIHRAGHITRRVFATHAAASDECWTARKGVDVTSPMIERLMCASHPIRARWIR